MMHFNVLYHFYIPHRGAIFAKATIEMAGCSGNKANRVRIEEVFGGCL
ncbi:MAG: hypothetical protein LBB09_03070 [Rickettsiales bacterium]|nr:hypothetical protein [Rickettsiales bacterium]